jgi:PmbA protein
VATTSSSDWTDAGLERCVADALSLVELSERDEFAGPADPALLSKGPYQDLDLFDDSLDRLDADQALKLAERAERIALDQDPRLTLSEGATWSRVTGWSAMVLSSGFSAVRRGSFASLSVVPVAEDEGGKKRRGHYWTGSRHLSGLEPLERVGEQAAQRTLRQLGARKVPTCQVPIVFDTDAARSLLSSFIGCAMGGAIWRRSSYLAEREGTQVASPLINIVDDPLIPRGPGSRVFDGEGLAAQRNVVVENGVLKTFLLDSYCGRKLNKASTASAGRSGGGVGPSTSNLLLQPGQQTPEELIASTPRGLFVTEMMGFGFNAVTGDFSRGAAGFWIEDGKLAFPVSEITISSNLDQMLQNIDAVANDLVLKSSTACPTLRVSQMTIAGS